ncbi:MAG TPA: DUF99 family protein [Candidatus Altiarchaeales archaeon]|nr:DUF99 family protein [Candidatus Altiarchaeales archaeon]
MAKFYGIKGEVRVLGVDDGPHKRGSGGQVLLVGTVFRGGSFMDGVMSTSVTADGIDATERLTEMVLKRRFKDIRVIMLDGLGFGGFNHVDIHKLSEDTGLPVIVVVRKEPGLDDIKSALKNLDEFDFRWGCVENAGKPIPVETRPGKSIHIQFAGIKEEQAVEITKLCSTRSMIPEPIRVAHLIAQGVVSGTSKGKA